MKSNIKDEIINKVAVIIYEQDKKLRCLPALSKELLDRYKTNINHLVAHMELDATDRKPRSPFQLFCILLENYYQYTIQKTVILNCWNKNLSGPEKEDVKQLYQEILKARPASSDSGDSPEIKSPDDAYMVPTDNEDDEENPSDAFFQRMESGELGYCLVEFNSDSD